MLIGFIIAVVGFLFLISSIIPEFVLDFNIIWPIILMIIAAYNMFRKKKFDAFLGVLMFVGVWYLFVNTGIIGNEYDSMFWSIIIIIIGLSVMYNAYKFTESYSKRKKQIDNTNREIMTYNGVFAGVDEKVKDEDFKGANIYAVFGGVELDLTTIKIKDDVIITIYSVFGGTSIKMPKGYNVIVNSTAIFGGCDNTVDNEYNEKSKTIYINSVAVFGGNEIK